VLVLVARWLVHGATSNHHSCQLHSSDATMSGKSTHSSVVVF